LILSADETGSLILLTVEGNKKSSAYNDIEISFFFLKHLANTFIKTESFFLYFYKIIKLVCDFYYYYLLSL